MKVRYLKSINLNLRQSLMMMRDRHHGKDAVKERSQFTNLLVREFFDVIVNVVYMKLPFRFSGTDGILHGRYDLLHTFFGIDHII